MRNGTIGMLSLLIGSSAFAQQAVDPAETPAATLIDTVTVTATRTATPAFEIPASIDVIDGGELHEATLGVNLSEGLSSVPGLLARDRQNYAQDTQISIRGFGARSTFGIRGVRLLLDGIPATQPDGQGQISHFNLATADRVEVLRGPFSALYGNSSGGVIQLFTADGRDPPQLSVGSALGSFNTLRVNAGASGIGELAGRALDYNFGAAHFSIDGFRDHSQARRESFNGKLNLRTGDRGKLTLVVNAFDSPDVDDPLGLTRAQFDHKPRQAAPVATQFDTRKSADQNQGGLIYEYALTPSQDLRVLGYYGQRGVRQYLAIPQSAQANPRHSGGVVDLDTGYGGGDARWTWRASLAQRPLTLVAGASVDDLSQQRRGYENFVGDRLGVKGGLRRDETDRVHDVDQYLQANWQFASQWLLLAGLRHSRVVFDSNDHYINDRNPDDSGRKPYSATTPVAGLLFQYNDLLHLYAAYGKGFETPTFAELAYKPSGDSGLNLDLDAARTINGEVGAKLRLFGHTRAQLALFQADTRKELVICANSGGRSAFCNTDRTRRQGAELSLETELAPRLVAQLAYTWLEASVRRAYLTCIGTPCTAPNALVAVGNRLAGTAQSSVYGGLRFGGDSGWQASIDGRYFSPVPVNDINSESAPSYGLVGIGGGYVIDSSRWRTRLFVNLDNLFDRDYVGSVIVNDGNGRYFEPGPGRSVVAGIGLDWRY